MKIHLRTIITFTLSLFATTQLHAGDFTRWVALGFEPAIETRGKTNSDGSYTYEYKNVSGRTYNIIVMTIENKEMALNTDLGPGKSASVHTYQHATPTKVTLK